MNVRKQLRSVPAKRCISEIMEFLLGPFFNTCMNGNEMTYCISSTTDFAHEDARRVIGMDVSGEVACSQKSPVLDGEADEAVAAAFSELGADVGAMGIDGAGTDEQLFRDIARFRRSDAGRGARWV
jgi:hypothetical protein